MTVEQAFQVNTDKSLTGIISPISLPEEINVSHVTWKFTWLIPNLVGAFSWFVEPCCTNLVKNRSKLRAGEIISMKFPDMGKLLTVGFPPSNFDILSRNVTFLWQMSRDLESRDARQMSQKRDKMSQKCDNMSHFGHMICNKRSHAINSLIHPKKKSHVTCYMSRHT